MKQWLHSKTLLCSILTFLILLFAVMAKVKGSPFSKASHNPVPTKHPNQSIPENELADDPLDHAFEIQSNETTSPANSPVVAFTQPPVEPENTPNILPTEQPIASSASPSATTSTSPTAVTTSTPFLPGKAPSISITPAGIPNAVPTFAPTSTPSIVPTKAPTGTPTIIPTLVATITPTKAPVATVTLAPTKVPTLPPTATPTAVPTLAPTATPTVVPTKAPTSTPQKYKDGLYTGYGNGRSGTIAVSVRIRGGKIYRIEIISHEDTASIFNQATAVISQIITTQSTNVDAVSGATASSNGIKEAVKNALSKA